MPFNVENLKVQAVRLAYDKGIDVACALTWGAAASITSAWLLFVKPLVDLPVVHFAAHPDVVRYLLASGLTSAMAAMVLAVAVRSMARRFEPSLDARPTIEEVIRRLGATTWSRRILVRTAMALLPRPATNPSSS